MTIFICGELHLAETPLPVTVEAGYLWPEAKSPLFFCGIDHAR